MDEKMGLLLERIDFARDHYNLLEDCKLIKIKLFNKRRDCQIFIKKNEPICIEALEELEDKKYNFSDDINNITICFEIENMDIEGFKGLYPYVLKKAKDILTVPNIYLDSLEIEDDNFILVANNNVEKSKLDEALDIIKKEFSRLGFRNNVSVILKEENLIKEKIEENLKESINNIKKNSALRESNLNAQQVNNDISKDKPKYRKKETDPNSIIGFAIKDEPIKIKTILGADNNIVVEAQIFGVDYFESSKSDFKIITLKITDYTDSIYCKVFVRDNDEYIRLCKELKSGRWLKIRGATKDDPFSRELVLNARDIMAIEHNEEEEITDTSSVKRVELHTHTKMSQMDGVADEKELVKQAIKWGHKGIAITDHNGCQAFPHIFNFVRDHNKKLKDGEDPFKVIYGTELTLIDDTVDIVVRPNDKNLLEQTYVVFDFETTGFNAGGADSIIEIGAVKIHNGEIIEKYDELIKPPNPLKQTITDVTNITNEMLEDKDNEENAIKRFIEWFGDLPMVAHNAKFDVSFLEMCYRKYNLGEYTNPVIDTLELSRTLDNNYSRHSLSAIIKRYDVPWDEDCHHRGDYDAEGTALVFHKMLKKLDNRNIERMDQLDSLVSKDEIHKYGKSYHINILALNKIGLKNMFRLISLANTKYLYKTPRILRSEIEKNRNGLLIGSGCYESEVFREARSKSEEELTNIIRFYDYVEVQPLECYNHLIQSSDFTNEYEISEHLKKIIRTTEEAGKFIVATGDVHHIKRDDKIYREIIVNQKVPGGGRHPLARNGIKDIPSNHLRTTDEMLENFKFLDDSNLVDRIVIDNPNKILDMVQDIEVIIDTGGIPFSPKIENCSEIVRTMVYDKAHSMYGDPLPQNIEDRIKSELKGIIGGGFDVIYLISQKLVKHSNDDGYLVGSRGSVGSSFVACMMGITEVNALPAHYLCYNCKYSEFNDDNGIAYGKELASGYDLPDKICPKCWEKLGKEGQDMPFATFLGFNCDKVPDIDLNFSGDNQASAHAYTKVLFGEDNVYRAGTIGTVAEKTAFGYVRGWAEEHGIVDIRNAEIERLAIGCTGVKRTTGQHPGGIVVIPKYMDVFDFTPFQYPADEVTAEWRTTHFDYHAIDQDVLKLDILGHDDPTVLRMLQDLSGVDVTTIPMDDSKVFSLLSSPEALGVTEEQIMCPTGTLGLPELGTKFVIAMLQETKPKTFSELVKISGLSHGTDVWAGNASELIEKGIVPFKEVIGCRDDIMVSLMNWGMEPKVAFKIMEFVRKGKPSRDPATWQTWASMMKEANIPDWYIESCHKIKYMFPKAHACAYVMSAIRIAWFKLYQPYNYYAAFFSIRVDDFDIEVMIKGEEAIRERLTDLQNKGFEATNKETNIIETLKIALEAVCRGIKFANIDLEKSEATKFIKKEDDEYTLIPPFSTIDGLGNTVAATIVKERKERSFISKEDVQTRGKVSQTLIAKMTDMGILNGLPDSNQLSLF